MISKFTTISLCPKFLDNYCRLGVVRKAIEHGLFDINHLNIRDFAVDNKGSVDSKPYGGGGGMVLRPEPLKSALDSIKTKTYVIVTDPRGQIWNQSMAKDLLKIKSNIVIICGRFKGIDQRFIDIYADQIISIGDFIISGGEIAALAIIDSVVRLIPNILSKKYLQFSDDHVNYPLYTKPKVFNGLSVPEILLSGDHDKILKWRKDSI